MFGYIQFTDHEVNINDCEQWFPLIKLKMSLDKASAADIQTTQDKLCMTALKSSVSSYKLSNSENDESNTWHLQPINNAFLQSVLNLIRHMHDEHRILFMLYFVANNAPPGADQVEATYECYKFAQENIEELQKQTRTLDLIQKINRKYPMHKIQHLLHLYGLNDERFLQLIENPRELITALYMHESVTNPVNKIDINQASWLTRWRFVHFCRTINVFLSFYKKKKKNRLLKTLPTFMESTYVIYKNCCSANGCCMILMKLWMAWSKHSWMTLTQALWIRMMK